MREFRKHCEYFGNFSSNRLLVSSDGDIRTIGHLVRIIDACYLGALTTPSGGVDSLRIPSNAGRQWGRDMNFQGSTDPMECVCTITPIRRNGGDHWPLARLQRLDRQGRYPSTLLSPIFAGKSEILMGTRAQVIAVDESGRPLSCRQRINQGAGQGGLARGRQTGQPQCQRMLRKRLRKKDVLRKHGR